MRWVGTPRSDVHDAIAAAGFTVTVIPKPQQIRTDDDAPLALIVDVHTASLTTLHHLKDVLAFARDSGIVVILAVDPSDNLSRARIDTELREAKGTFEEVSCSPGALVAHLARLHVPPFVRCLELDIRGVHKLASEHRVLLQRAFGEFKSIVLESIEEGTTGSSWIVNGIPHDNVPGEVVPFFAKVADTARILNERSNYSLYVDQHLPSTLCPRLLDSRCTIGHEHSLLVISAVEDSGSLHAAFVEGLAGNAINAVFDRCLRIWQTSARVQVGSFARLLEPGRDQRASAWLHDSSALSARAQRVRPRRMPTELLACFRHAPQAHFGLIHGDLHHRNVRVLGQSAVVFDFEKTMFGPSIVDRTLLEVSLAFEATKSRPDETDGALRELYGPSAIRTPPRRHLAGPLRRFAQSVCQLRRAAHSHCDSPEEYAWGVAAALLRYARLQTLKSISEQELRELDERRRGLALSLADDLLEALHP